MKTSCVRHPQSEPLIIIRAWQLQATNGNRTAASLLSFFEYWHNVKIDQSQKNREHNDIAERHGDRPTQDTSLYQFHSADQLEAGILIFKKDAIREGLKILEGLGFISIHKNPNPRYKFDNTKHFLFHPEAVNEWLNKERVPTSPPPQKEDPQPSREDPRPSLENRQRSLENRQTIPKTTPETTTEITSEITHTYNAHEQSQNLESVSDQTPLNDLWQEPEPEKPKVNGSTQPTVNQIPQVLSKAPHCSASRERESFSNFQQPLRLGAISARRLNNLEKAPSEWWGRWRTGNGPNQWHEGFIDWMTHNWIQGAKRNRASVIGYLVNCEGDKTGAALQKLEAYFDSYEASWEAETGHSSEQKWLAVAARLYKNTKELEQRNAA